MGKISSALLLLLAFFSLPLLPLLIPFSISDLCTDGDCVFTKIGERFAMSPYHPADLLPLLPHRVAWPILTSIRSAADLLPSFVGFANNYSESSLNWKGACFYQTTAWLEFNNKSGTPFGGGTVYIKVC